ncbi:iron-containing alcohol dehydrogenase family protein [Halomicrobium salinisoli]|uniref:iron-containing alcohol dehydrogenase family protein n=1 Tax=Halomicrobium salinisoli TaxID=2878391 RepID=UPI001CEFFA3D|nr:iron-containing alcohol dehydrogenase family protein [Halomicrobium salinisoli]
MDAFRFEYDPAVLRCGRGAAADLGAELDALGLERALVVTGETVGSTAAVMDPVRDGLGDRLVGLFDETTPAKRLATAVAGAAAIERTDADVLVAVGGGSSVDVAKVAGVVAAGDRSAAELGAELAETGTLSVPDESTPVVAVPTTMAGADHTAAAGITATPDGGLVDRPVDGGISDPALMPAAVVYDPDLVGTTPRGVLAASAMNGFDKGIETLYARASTPITDATARRGLRQFRAGLLGFADGDPAPEDLDRAVEGLALVQYGISRPDAGTLSVIHAFGHGVSRPYPVQQGRAHGVLAPYVLEYVFDAVDGRRNLLAEALDVGDADDPAAAVVDAVREVADALGLPDSLRDVDGPEPDEFDDVARAVVDDALMANAPAGLDPTPAAVRAVLEAAW